MDIREIIKKVIETVKLYINAKLKQHWVYRDSAIFIFKIQESYIAHYTLRYLHEALLDLAKLHFDKSYVAVIINSNYELIIMW